MIAFSNVPAWLLRALGFQTTRNIADIQEEVQPTLDIMQGGWGIADWNVLNFDRAASTATNVETLLDADERKLRLVTALSLKHVAGAGATMPELRLVRQGRSPRVFARNVAPNEFADSALIMPAGFIIVPPNTTFQISWPTTGVGETWELRGTYLDMPPGFKPI